MTVAKPHANAANASQPQGNTALAPGASSAPSSGDTVDEVPRGDAADVRLRVAYPGERKRASAVRWLGWLAYQMRDDRRVPWRALPSGAQDLWRLQPWPGGALAVARTIGAGIFVVLGSSLAVCGILVGWWHGLVVFRRWASMLPETLEFALLRRPLRYAVAHRVLVQTDNGYTFSDPALQAALTARYQADLNARAGKQASRTTQTSGRTRLLACLDNRGITRIAAAVTTGALLYVVAAGSSANSNDSSYGNFVVVLLLLLLGGLYGVRTAAPLARWTMASIPGLSRADATTVAALTAAVLAALIIWSGPALAAVLAAVLPAAFVAACGLWVCLLTRRALARLRHRGLLRYLPDAIAAVTIGIAAAVLVNRSLLTTEPATVLLFPIATWGSLRAWRAMNHSGRFTVHAAADLTLSLLLGAELVLFAVWLSNLLDLSRDEVSVLRAVTGRAGSLADLPWWTWAAAYLILAATIVARGRWPGLPRQVTDLLRVAPAVGGTKRVLTGLHIGLLVIVFVAVAAPITVKPLLRHQIRTRYDVALQRELEATQVLDAYAWIRAGLVPVTLSGVLQEVVATILKIGHLSTGGTGVATEGDLAQRLGRLQATTLTLPPPPKTPEAAGDNAPGLDEEINTLDTEEHEADEITKLAEKFGEYTAVAVASTISIPHVSDHEVVQIIREYLNGLIEESPLKDIVAAWYRNIRWRGAPPPADEIIDPNAARLENAASAELNRAAPESQDVTNVLKAIRDEPPAVAAVELTNATRYGQEGTGPCDSICRLDAPSGAPGEPVVKPPEPVEPEPPADPFVDFPH
jgi:hypothetical protein